MNAREQAREAARQEVGHGDSYMAARFAGADAASDVWEPIVRDLMDGILQEVASGHLRDPLRETWDAMRRAKEALQ